MSSSLLLGSKGHEYALADQDEEIAEIKQPSRGRMAFFVKVLGLVVLFVSWTYLVGSNSYHAGVKRVASEYQKHNIDGELPIFLSRV